jgi:short chain dehydrogenase
MHRTSRLAQKVFGSQAGQFPRSCRAVRKSAQRPAPTLTPLWSRKYVTDGGPLRGFNLPTSLTMSRKTIVPAYKDVYPSIDASIYTPGEFKDKVVVVTGAGSGIGRETALAFSQLGAKVAFVDWKVETAEKTAEEAKERFKNTTIVLGGDVSKIEDTERIYNSIVKELGEIEVAVFSAGYGLFDKFVISREKDWWGLIETNLKGPIDFARLALPGMVKRNSGKLIFISSRVRGYKCFANLGWNHGCSLLNSVQCLQSGIDPLRRMSATRAKRYGSPDVCCPSRRSWRHSTRRH